MHKNRQAEAMPGSSTAYAEASKTVAASIVSLRKETSTIPSKQSA
ncbi:MAG: hypothetical protein ACNYZG_00695 [Gammaproteobacteria bacterium]